MSPRPWIFLINTFEVNTRENYKKALSIGEDHKAKLQTHSADPDIAALIATYNPVFGSYKSVNLNLESVLGTYKGKTQTVEELFSDLAKIKLPQWEGQVHFFYPEGTAGDTNLFPNRRSPFNDGTYEQRIAAIKVLGDKCALDPSLVPLSVNVLAFWTQIEAARLSQQADGEGQAEGLRVLREGARILPCDELYGDLGALMKKHKSNPLAVGQYFEESYLRSTNNVERFSVQPGEVVNVLANAVPGDVTGLRIRNTSDEDAPVEGYLAVSSVQIPSGSTTSVHKDEVKVLDEALMGTFQPFLNFINNSGHVATFEVTGL